MTTKTQEAPATKQAQDPNRPQVGYALYHPEHGFAETCSSFIEDLTDRKNEGLAILLYLEQDVAHADRLQRGWSDEAQIVVVRIPGASGNNETDPAELLAQENARLKQELKKNKVQVAQLLVDLVEAKLRKETSNAD